MRLPFRFYETRKGLELTPAARQAATQGFNPLPTLGGGARDRIVAAYQTAKSANYAWLYANSPAVRTVIDEIVRNVGQLELRLYEEVSESERQPRPDHPAALSLRYPSETVPADQFIRTMFRDYLIAADAVSIMAPAPSNRLMFKWIPISRVQFLGNNMFDTDVYRVNDALGGTYTDFPAENVFHWRGEHPDDPRVGLSHLETLRNVIAEDVAMQQANTELAKAGMTESTWVYRPIEAPEWSNAARSGFEEDLTNRLKRSRNMPVVLEEGMELRPMGVSPADAQALDLRKFLKAEVAAEYGLPLGMIGLADNVAEAQASFYADTLPPLCEEFTSALNLRILVRAYNWTDGCFEFNLDEKHMGDDRLKALTSASGRPVLLTNEARAMLNRPPVDGGDELVTPANVTVGENPLPSVNVMPIEDPNAPVPADGSGRAADNPAGLQKAQLVHLHPGRKADLERQSRNIDLMKGVLDRNFERLAKGLALKAVGSRKFKAEWSSWDASFSEDLRKAVEQVVDKEGAIYAFKLGGEFDMKRVKHYLSAMAEGAAVGINEAVRAEIQKSGVDAAVGAFPQRVEAFAAGLGAQATIWAREEAARQAPGTESRVKVWIPDTDRHAAFGGDTVALGADWPAGFAPGSAPGCKCSMAIE